LGQPASFQVAIPRHAMALAFRPQVLTNHLPSCSVIVKVHLLARVPLDVSNLPTLPLWLISHQTPLPSRTVVVQVHLFTGIAFLAREILDFIDE